MSKTWLKDLNSAQQQAVCFGEGPLLILAGAGSGKTRALTYRAAWLVKEKLIPPDRLLLLTFTNKAAGEMKQRIKKLVKQTPPFAGTFHSFCAKLLRQHGPKIKLASNFAIFDETDQLKVLKQALERLDLSAKEFKPRSVLATISSAKNELIDASEYSGYARGHWQKSVSQIYFIYQKILQEYEALDFDDLLNFSVKLLQADKPTLSYYQNKYQFVLVDEYQDTNRAQYVLTQLLSAKWRNLTVVGDASQSIYGWRGADFRNLLNLQTDFPNLKTINLDQNYRSTNNILQAAYGVISKNTSHPILELWTDQPAGPNLIIFEAKDEKQEARFIVDKILELSLKAKLSNIAVLYRTNAQSRVLEEAFLKQGVAYHLVGGTRFYNRKEIKDCLAYLQLLNNHKNLVAYQRLEKLGKRQLSNFLKLADDLKLKLTSLTTLEILELVLKKTKYLDRFDKKNEEDLARLENIKELKSVAQEFPQLDEFLLQVALVEQKNLPDYLEKNDSAAVQLMTLHAAKGLEFKTVFMVGMEEGLFPHSRSMLEKDELEEERRLCYVGITRAKKQVFFTCTRQRLYFGQRSQNSVSRFMADIPPHLVEVQR